MEKNFTEKAYAKVNFNLRILPKRSDEFHNLESIFQTIDLFDELEVSVAEESGCFVECSSMVIPQKNTISMAYEAFCQTAGVKVPGIRVVLKKGIPAGGGLGGGSADAAALVRILERLCNIRLSDNQRNYIAEKTGSDVFFFMHCDDQGKGCALVSGRGEIVKKIQGRRDLFLVLVFPGICSSTKEAYDLVDRNLQLQNCYEFPVLEELEAIYRKDPSEWNFINTFTPSLCGRYSDLSRALEALKNSGAEFSDMSGSGSTLFGVFSFRQRAEACMKLLVTTWKCALVQLL
ncbi:MAG: 4-(cytidine 5'-diphospho)-2-C-methyl-D-erythritol kinase [Treponema sp.]|nr:4-(cytidine 5'-diphospho)-2-C-methyl-D-erythritol kinase [Treponema sp.]